MNLASMLIEDGEYEEAAFHYRKAIEEKPSAEAQSGLGFALNQLGRLEEAAAEHDAAVALDARLAEVYRNRALTQPRLGVYEEAIRSYRRGVASSRVSRRIIRSPECCARPAAARRPRRNTDAAASRRVGRRSGCRPRRLQAHPPKAARGPEPTPTGGRPGMPK